MVVTWKSDWVIVVVERLSSIGVEADHARAVGG